MTAKPKTRKATASAPKQRRAMTKAEAAAIDFEPWEGEVETEKLPNNEQFREAGFGHLITCRIALVMMYQTKAELAGMFEQEWDVMTDLVENMGTAKNFFRHFCELLDAASARLIVAGCGVCKDVAKKGERGQDWGSG